MGDLINLLVALGVVVVAAIAAETVRAVCHRRLSTPLRRPMTRSSSVAVAPAEETLLAEPVAEAA